MTDRINSVIKFDLHIHSQASAYKEASGIVDNSTKDNLDVLFRKLNEHQVAMFSITDHNRFDADLYLEIIRKLKDDVSTYPNIKNVLAGVEFDVKLEDGMKNCHIITIFDTKNIEDNLRKIESEISKKQLAKREAFYTKKDFEIILKNINLDVILIACQRKEISNKNGNHNSLSDSTSDVWEMISTRYINALEFQKPKVEGILIDNLKELDTPITLLSGSDCHDWVYYPYHDGKNQNKDFHHSTAKILPTFKGLLMAITSPETRFNRTDKGQKVIDSIEINGSKIPLTQGINTIIGENGSGKTTLLELIGNPKKPYTKKIIAANSMKCNTIKELDKIKYVSQGQIVQDFIDNKLFNDGSENNFQELDNASFEAVYKAYATDLKKCIELNIDKNKIIPNLKSIFIKYKEHISPSSYYISTLNNTDDQKTDNIHKEPYKNIEKTIIELNAFLNQEYFQQHKDKIKEAIIALTSIYENIKKQYISAEYILSVKNIINGSIADYQMKLNEKLPSAERESEQYKSDRINFLKHILSAIKKSVEITSWPLEPERIKGIKQNKKQGFSFNTEAIYHDKPMLADFLSKMFVSEYRDIDRIKEINSSEEFQKAIMSCSRIDDISSKWSDNLTKFIEVSTKCNNYILEDSGGQKIGNTLGEMSISYYKYYTNNNSCWDLFMIDQPEDNISNNNVRQKLISYFNSIREGKQLIFVTHNPLLVVNLDTDNVIFVKNDNGNINAFNGCLEYEDNDVNILNLVADNMDGGKETIERRLRVYGKSN